MKLEPCPMCGGKGEVEWGKVYAVRCKSCREYGEAGEGEVEAVVLWNERSNFYRLIREKERT